MQRHFNLFGANELRVGLRVKAAMRHGSGGPNGGHAFGVSSAGSRSRWVPRKHGTQSISWHPTQLPTPTCREVRLKVREE